MHPFHKALHGKFVLLLLFIIMKGIYRQTPGGGSDGLGFGSMGSGVQAVGSLFGRGGVADLGEVAGRHRVHRGAGQPGAEELGLQPGCGAQHFGPLRRARRSDRPTVRCWRDAFRHPHHLQELLNEVFAG